MHMPERGSMVSAWIILRKYCGRWYGPGADPSEEGEVDVEDEAEELPESYTESVICSSFPDCVLVFS